jgi:hypothetical protein
VKWLAASIVVLAIALVATVAILAFGRDEHVRVKIERECKNPGIYGCTDGGLYGD